MVREALRGGADARWPGGVSGQVVGRQPRKSRVVSFGTVGDMWESKVRERGQEE